MRSLGLGLAGLVLSLVVSAPPAQAGGIGFGFGGGYHGGGVAIGFYDGGYGYGGFGGYSCGYGRSTLQYLGGRRCGFGRGYHAGYYYGHPSPYSYGTVAFPYYGRGYHYTGRYYPARRVVRYYGGRAFRGGYGGRRFYAKGYGRGSGHRVVYRGHRGFGGGFR